MHPNTSDIRVESIEPINGKIRVKYFPELLAKNPEFMKRNGYKIAQIAKPETVTHTTAEVMPEPPQDNPIIPLNAEPFQIEDSTGLPAKKKRKYTKRKK